MDTKQVAEGLVALCREGRFQEAMAQFYSPNIVSVEAADMSGSGREVRGIEATIEKGKQFDAMNEVHSVAVTGPYLSGDQFAAIYKLEITHKPSGQRFEMEEVAVYQVEDGKIVHEQFYYNM